MVEEDFLKKDFKSITCASEEVLDKFRQELRTVKNERDYWKKQYKRALAWKDTIEVWKDAAHSLASELETVERECDCCQKDSFETVAGQKALLFWALEELYEVQNDAPLERYRQQWTRAMTNARQVLDEYKKGDE